MAELKPCPLCGKAAQIKTIHKKFQHGWIGCLDCHLYIQWAHDPAAAIERWNRRKGE